VLELRTGAIVVTMVLGLAACGGAEPPAESTGPAASQTPATSVPAQPEPAEPERPWMLGLRWQGPADERVEFDVQYHLEGQLGTQEQTTTPRVRSTWSYMIGSPWVRGMTVAARMDTGSGPVAIELIRARTVTDSPIIDSADDVEIDAVLASTTVGADAPATLQGGAVPDAT
jgi:hypothetical protein